jgi:hypothetical protein
MLCFVPTERKSFPESLPMVKTIGCIIRRTFSTINFSDLCQRNIAYVMLRSYRTEMIPGIFTYG